MGVTAGDVLEDEWKSGGLHPVTSGQMDALSDEQLMMRLEGPEVEAAIARLYDRYGRTCSSLRSGLTKKHRAPRWP